MHFTGPVSSPSDTKTAQPMYVAIADNNNIERRQLCRLWLRLRSNGANAIVLAERAASHRLSDSCPNDACRLSDAMHANRDKLANCCACKPIGPPYGTYLKDRLMAWKTGYTKTQLCSSSEWFPLDGRGTVGTVYGRYCIWERYCWHPKL